MTEENGPATNPEEKPLLGKFKDADALARAYEELEAEFTRRSQKLKALEARAAEGSGGGPSEPRRADADGEELYRAVTEHPGLKARILSEYLQSLKGVPLLGGAGAGVTAPKLRPATIAEAGELALGYFRRNENK